ncbi:MAG TPA: hypothetical protein VM537_27310 [Anaerolineae bacterium]|nr:hypothetical protein [Anaerolineae bacterium]
MPPKFASQLEVVTYQLREEVAHRPLEFLLRIGRTILKNPAATKEQVLASAAFREGIWTWLLTARGLAQTVEAQTDLDVAGGLALLPDEAPAEEPLG